MQTPCILILTTPPPILQSSYLPGPAVQSRRALDDMDNNGPSEDDNGDAAKYELLVKRDQEMTAFMDKFEETRNNVLSEQKTAKDMIVALLESVSKGIEDSTSMPSVETMNEMESTRSFKEKNMATAQRTMEGLQKEKAKREKELLILRDSEPKLTREVSRLTVRHVCDRTHICLFFLGANICVPYRSVVAKY